MNTDRDRKRKAEKGEKMLKESKIEGQKDDYRERK